MGITGKFICVLRWGVVLYSLCVRVAGGAIEIVIYINNNPTTQTNSAKTQLPMVHLS